MKKLMVIMLALVFTMSFTVGIFADETAANPPAQQDQTQTQNQNDQTGTPALQETQASAETPAIDETKTDEQLATDDAATLGEAADQAVQDETTTDNQQAAAEKVAKGKAAAYKLFGDEFKALNAVRIANAKKAVAIKANNVKIKGLVKIAQKLDQKKKLVNARLIELEINATESFIKTANSEVSKLWKTFNEQLKDGKYKNAELTLKKIVVFKKLTSNVLGDILSLQQKELKVLK